MHRCIMHVRLSEKHGLGASCYKYRGAHLYSMGNETSAYQNNTKVKYVTIHGVNRWNSLS